MAHVQQLDKTDIIHHIKNHDKVLSLPQVLSEVLTEAGKEDFTAASLARIILKDPALTTATLRLANSSFYQRLTEIKTVDQAVNMLGVTTIKCMALSSSILDPERVAKNSGVDPKVFFSGVLSNAAASEQIAKAIEYKAPDEAFVGGLLLDIGILFLIHHYPEQYRRIVNGDFEAATLTEAERKIFGCDHAEIGFHLARIWNLPEYLQTAIRKHHEFTAVSDDEVLVNVVRLAALLTPDEFSGFQPGIEDRLNAIKTVSETLSISREKTDEITFSLPPLAIETADYLGVDIGSIEEILVRANQEIWKSYITIESLFKERQELTNKLLEQERAKGAIESKNMALATLSHYINNAVMAVYGRSQLIRMQHDKNRTEELMKGMRGHLDVLDRSTRKIIAVLEEMKSVSPLDQQRLYKMSNAMNIDDLIERRLAAMESEPDLTQVAVPSDA